MFRWTAGTRARVARAVRQNRALPPTFHAQKIISAPHGPRCENFFSTTPTLHCKQDTNHESSTSAPVETYTRESKSLPIEKPFDSSLSVAVDLDVHPENSARACTQVACESQIGLNSNPSVSDKLVHENFEVDKSVQPWANEGVPLSQSENVKLAEDGSKGGDSLLFKSLDNLSASSLAREQARFVLRMLAKNFHAGEPSNLNREDSNSHLASSKGARNEKGTRCHAQRCRTYAEQRWERDQQRRMRAKRIDAFERADRYRKPLQLCVNHTELGLSFDSSEVACQKSEDEAAGVDVLGLQWPFRGKGIRYSKDHIDDKLKATAPDPIPVPPFIEKVLPSHSVNLRGTVPLEVNHVADLGLHAKEVSPSSFALSLRGAEKPFSDRHLRRQQSSSLRSDNNIYTDIYCLKPSTFVSILSPPSPIQRSKVSAAIIPTKLNSSCRDEDITRSTLTKPPLMPSFSSPLLINVSANSEIEANEVFSTISTPPRLTDNAMNFNNVATGLPGSDSSSAFRFPQPWSEISAQNPASPLGCSNYSLMSDSIERFSSHCDNNVQESYNVVNQSASPALRLQTYRISPSANSPDMVVGSESRPFEERTIPYNIDMPLLPIRANSPRRTSISFRDAFTYGTISRPNSQDSFLNDSSCFGYDFLNTIAPSSPSRPSCPLPELHMVSNTHIELLGIDGLANPFQRCELRFEDTHQSLFSTPQVEPSSTSNAHKQDVPACANSFAASHVSYPIHTACSIASSVTAALQNQQTRGTRTARPRAFGRHALSRCQQFRDRCQRPV